MAKKNSELVENVEGTEVVEVKDTITVVCPHCNNELAVEIPKTPAHRRGQLAGLSIEEMSDEQLKREKINAASVHYKATKRGAVAETIQKTKERLDAVNAEIEKRKASKVVVSIENVADTTVALNQEIAAEM